MVILHDYGIKEIAALRLLFSFFISEILQIIQMIGVFILSHWGNSNSALVSLAH